MKFDVKAISIAKEVRKASAEWTNANGEKVAAKPKAYLARFAIGNIENKDNPFITGDVRLSTVELTRESYLTLNKIETFNIEVELKEFKSGNRYDILAIDGLEIVCVEEVEGDELDEEEDEN